jgi:hypothetical protein
VQQLFVQYSCMLYGYVDRTIKLIVQKLSFRRYGHVVANGEKAAKGLLLYAPEDTFLVFFPSARRRPLQPRPLFLLCHSYHSAFSTLSLCSSQHVHPTNATYVISLSLCMSLCHSVTLSIYLRECVICHSDLALSATLPWRLLVY